jgi:transcriptional regulator with XRE-family HTH domain
MPRTPNLELRRARQAMRLSQAQFADAIRAAGNAMGVENHCTKRLVQKWETGEHAACRPDYLRVLQAVTGLSARELGFRLLPDDAGLSAATSGDGKGGVGGESADSGAASAPASGKLGSAEYTSDAMIEGSADRLRYALNRPSVADSRTAELVEMATVRLFDLEHHSPARLLAPTVDRHLSMVTALLTAARHEAVRRRLTVSAGMAALLAGWLAFDRGDIASSHRLWEDAISTAQATTNDSLFAAALTYQSYSAARRGDPGTAWQLAHVASARTLDDPRATAWAMSRVAQYAAQLGERVAAERAMRHSLEIGYGLPSPAPEDGSKPWTRAIDDARLLASAAHTAALLKAPNAAAYAVKAVDALAPAKVKSRAIVYAEAALTAAIVGELELCLDYGGMAARLTRDLEVSIAADLMYDVLPLLLPYSDTRAVRELLPQLTRLTRTADLEDQANEGR